MVAPSSGDLPPPTTGHDFRAGYVRRVVDDELDALLPALPALLLDGPKGVGKTATALQRARTVHRLDAPGPAAVAAADPSVLLDAPAPVLLDEWQRVPALWDAVKTAVDADPAGGRFLLTGSLPPSGTHSGAGRITGVRLRPLTLPERGTTTATVGLGALLDGDAPIGGTCPLDLRGYVDAVLASGFPGLQHLRGRPLAAALDGYLDRVVDAEMREAGAPVRRPAALAAWLRAYAAATATTTSWERLRDAATAGQDAKPAKTTTQPWVDALTRLRLLDELPAWTPGAGHLGRLALAPRHHLADPALAARLVGATAAGLLAGRAAPGVGDGAFLGQLFESLATLSVRVFAAAAGARVGHLRTHEGRHEVDLVVERDQRVLALEVKLAEAVADADVRHLLWLRSRLGDALADAVVLTTGHHAYRRRDGIAVVPLGLLGR